MCMCGGELIILIARLFLPLSARVCDTVYQNETLVNQDCFLTLAVVDPLSPSSSTCLQARTRRKNSTTSGPSRHWVCINLVALTAPQFHITLPLHLYLYTVPTICYLFLLFSSCLVPAAGFEPTPVPRTRYTTSIPIPTPRKQILPTPIKVGADLQCRLWRG